MPSTFDSHEKRLHDLNSQLDTKFRDVINSVAAVSQLYLQKSPVLRRKFEIPTTAETRVTVVPPVRKKSTVTADPKVVRSRSRGVLTLDNNRNPPVASNSSKIPLPEKGILKIIKNVAPCTKMKAARNMLFENDPISTDDEEDLGAPNLEEPMEQQFLNVHFAETTDSTCNLQKAGSTKPDFLLNTKPNAPGVSVKKTQNVLKFPVELEPARKNLSSDALIKFLKTKISILHQELDTARKENQRLTKENTALTDEQQKIVNSKESYISRNIELEDKLKRREESISKSSSDLMHKNHELEELQRKLNASENSVLKLTRSNTNLEKRLAKIKEDLKESTDKLTSTTSDMEVWQTNRKLETRTAEEQLRVSEQKRDGLIAAYKKQMLLVDNLKRQNTCLQQAKLLEFVERDFVKMLNWSTEKK